jgi:ribosomal protein L23
MEALVKKQSIIRPLLSEKSVTEYRKNRTCTFWVSPKATKTEIAHEFKELFDIEAVKVQTLVSRKETNVRTKTRSELKRKVSKKAYINIGEQTLDIFENIK